MDEDGKECAHDQGLMSSFILIGISQASSVSQGSSGVNDPKYETPERVPRTKEILSIYRSHLYYDS